MHKAEWSTALLVYREEVRLTKLQVPAEPEA